MAEKGDGRRGLTEFYPSRKWVEKGWRPERLAGGVTQLAELVNVIRAGRAGGLPLSDADAGALLRNALAENRPDFGMQDYGGVRGKVKTFGKATPYEQRADYRRDAEEVVRALGGEQVPPEYAAKIPLRNYGAVEFSQYPEAQGMQIRPRRPKITKTNERGDPVAFQAMAGDLYGQNAQAYILTAMEKQRQAKAATLADLLENKTNWNGRGKVLGDIGRGKVEVLADAENHRQKLGRLQIPENAPLFELYDQMLEKGGYDPFYDARDLQVKPGRGY